MRKLTAVAVAASIVALTPASARDPDGKWEKQDPIMHAWFDQLASQRGLCCSFADGLALEDTYWESKDGHYRVLIPAQSMSGYNNTKVPEKDQWVEVPDNAIVHDNNRFGAAVVWPFMNGDQIQIRCFMPGAGT